jgi:hypothetical protein
MSKRTDKKKKKLEVKRETLRKIELTPQELGQVGGGRRLDDEDTGTYPSANVC